MPSLLAKDSNAVVVQLFTPTGTPQTITVDVAGGTAALSAAISTPFVRLQPTVGRVYLCTIAGAVTAGTGHYLAAGGCYDIQRLPGTTKISFLGTTATAGTCYLSELGNI